MIKVKKVLSNLRRPENVLFREKHLCFFVAEKILGLLFVFKPKLSFDQLILSHYLTFDTKIYLTWFFGSTKLLFEIKNIEIIYVN